jgi:RecA-family ATPase
MPDEVALSTQDDPLQTHPLAAFVEYDDEPRPPRYVIPGFIGDGLVIIAGHHGVGKTETILPLALVAAGVHAAEDPLTPHHWRHVVYLSEDTGQAQRILAGVVRYAGYGFDLKAVRERLHLVQAVRLDAQVVAEVGATYKERFTRMVDGVEVLPLVVLDTKSAILALDDENSNSESSRAMAALKQGFAGLPTWVIGHVAKAQGTGARNVSMRGGSAFEADANQVLYLVQDEDGGRYLIRGKTRFAAKWDELEIVWHKHDTTAQNEFGEWEPVTLSWSTVHPPQLERKEAAKAKREEAAKQADNELRQEVLHAVELAQIEGYPLNRAGIKAKTKRRALDVQDCIERLLAERWLVEVEVSAKMRISPSKKAFIVKLSTAEHDAVRAGAPIPAHLLEVPESWRKREPAPVPGPERMGAELCAPEVEA